jgi:hypothetical protein
MKRILSVCVGSLLILSTGHLFAQENGSDKMLEQVTVTATNTKVPQKVWENFLKYYPAAENPRWYDLNNRFFVRYWLQDEPSQSLFTKRGNLVYTISYCEEKDLPEAIRQEVKRKYFDYAIKGITKVSDQNDAAWMIHLEGARNYITVRMTDQEMEEVQKLNKS